MLLSIESAVFLVQLSARDDANALHCIHTNDNVTVQLLCDLGILYNVIWGWDARCGSENFEKNDMLCTEQAIGMGRRCSTTPKLIPF